MRHGYQGGFIDGGVNACCFFLRCTQILSIHAFFISLWLCKIVAYIVLQCLRVLSQRWHSFCVGDLVGWLIPDVALPFTAIRIYLTIFEAVWENFSNNKIAFYFYFDFPRLILCLVMSKICKMGLRCSQKDAEWRTISRCDWWSVTVRVDKYCRFNEFLTEDKSWFCCDCSSILEQEKWN